MQVPHNLKLAHKKLQEQKPGGLDVDRSIEDFVRVLCQDAKAASELKRRGTLVERQTGARTAYGQAKLRARKVRGLLLDVSIRPNLLLLTEITYERRALELLLSGGKLNPGETKEIRGWLDACRNIQREARPLEVDGCRLMYQAYLASQRAVD